MIGACRGQVRDLSDPGRRVLEFAALHSLVSGDQVAALLGTGKGPAAEQLSILAAAGTLIREQDRVAEPSRFRISAAGLDAIGSRSGPPQFESCVRKALAAGWLMLMAAEGTFGPFDRTLSERQMRLADREAAAGAPFAVAPGEFGGPPLDHCPDLMLLTKHGRIAVEMLLQAPTPRVLAPVLRAYAADVRISVVLCLASDPWIGRLVESVAAWLDLSPMVHVQPAMPPSG